MDRFIFPGDHAMRPNKSGKNPSTLAYFNYVDTTTGLLYNDVRLVKSEKAGIFAAGPFRTYEDKEGDTKYSNFWGPAWDNETNARDETGVAYMEELTKAALRKYEQVVGSAEAPRGRSSRSEENEDARPARRQSSTGGGAKKSGRGPVPSVSSRPDLPF